MSSRYLSRRVTEGVTDADGNARVLDLCVSIGEFEPEQTLLEVSDSESYSLTCLSYPALWEVRRAIDAAIRVHLEFLRQPVEVQEAQLAELAQSPA